MQKLIIKSLVVLFCGLSYIYASTINIPAKQALLIDLTSNTILFSKNADTPLPPSSMAKIMTAYMAFNELKNRTLTMEDKFVVSKRAWAKGAEGSRTFLNVGSKVQVIDLLRGLIVQSGNDAAVALAEGIAGSEEAFVELMQQKAKELGAYTAYFTNSTGLPDGDPLMSAYDIAKIAERTIKDFPEYYPFYSEISFEYNGITQRNRNPLLYSCSGCDGLKTGQTDAGGFGLVASVKKEGRRLLLVINGCKSTKERAIDSKRLMSWGFRYYTTETLFKAHSDIVEYADVWMGKQNKIPLLALTDVMITAPRSKLKNVKVELVYNAPLSAPIKKGDIVAKLMVYVPGKEAAEYPLVVSRDVEKANIFLRIFLAVKYLIFGS